MRFNQRVINVSNRFILYWARNYSNRKQLFFLKWCLSIKKNNLLEIAWTYFGCKMRVQIGDFIQYRIAFFGIWEPTVSFLISDLLAPGDTFIDVGANIGYHTLLAAKAVKKKGRVVAIEASDAIADQLRDNISMSRFKNIRVVQAAVSDKNEVLSLFGGDNSNIGRTSTFDRTGLNYIGQVMAYPLHVLLTVHEIHSVRLIKIDIEGGEIALLESVIENINLYSSRAAILVEFSYESPTRSQSAFSGLLRLGYRAYLVPNEYSFNYYLNGMWATDVDEIFDLPPTQSDILFQRTPFSWSDAARHRMGLGGGMPCAVYS